MCVCAYLRGGAEAVMRVGKHVWGANSQKTILLAAPSQPAANVVMYMPQSVVWSNVRPALHLCSLSLFLSFSLSLCLSVSLSLCLFVSHFLFYCGLLTCFLLFCCVSYVLCDVSLLNTGETISTAVRI